MGWIARALVVVCGLALCHCSGDDATDAFVGPSTGGMPAAGTQGVSGAAGNPPAATSGTGGTSVVTAGAAAPTAGSAGSATAGTAAPEPDAGAPAADAGEPDAGPPDMTRPPATSLMLPITMENPNAAPWFNVYRPMDLGATGQPVPVIVWANGGCFRSDFTWEPLFERWAAGGFVVLALTASPSGGALAQTSVADHGGMIDWALEQAEYADMLDHDRIIAAGNSCGGITALGLAAEDERVSAVFVLSGSSNVGSPNLTVINAISVPVGYVVGGSEDIAGANATADYEALPGGVPAMIVSRDSGDHITVSTDVNILGDVAEIALNWMDLALYGTPEAAEALMSANVCSSCDPVWTLTAKHLETLQP